MNTKVKKVTKTKNFPKWFKVILPSRTYQTADGQTIEAPAICLTEKVENIGRFDTNRDVDNQHINTIGGSVTKLGLTLRETVVICLNGKYAIADGQHLFGWLMKQIMPVEFKLCHVQTMEKAVEIMRKMNSSSRNWTLSQFIRVCAAINPHYAKLETLLEKYSHINMTAKMMVGLMYSDVRFFPTVATKAIKDGYFQQNVTDDKLNRVMEALENFYNTTKMDKSQYANWGLIDLIYDKRNTYFDNEAKFLKSVKKYVTKNNLVSKTFGKRVDYLNMFKECWDKM
jgi:hypothetical protein